MVYSYRTDAFSKLFSSRKIKATLPYILGWVSFKSRIWTKKLCDNHVRPWQGVRMWSWVKWGQERVKTNTVYRLSSPPQPAKVPSHLYLWGDTECLAELSPILLIEGLLSGIICSHFQAAWTWSGAVKSHRRKWETSSTSLRWERVTTPASHPVAKFARPEPAQKQSRKRKEST